MKAIAAELEDYLLQYPGTTLHVLYADAQVRDRVSFTAAREQQAAGLPSPAYADASRADVAGDPTHPAVTPLATT